MKSIKVQLVLSEETNSLLNEIAKKEYRTTSAIVELAILAYEEVIQMVEAGLHEKRTRAIIPNSTYQLGDDGEKYDIDTGKVVSDEEAAERAAPVEIVEHWWSSRLLDRMLRFLRDFDRRRDEFENPEPEND